jgi:hypothetical protein
MIFAADSFLTGWKVLDRELHFKPEFALIRLMINDVILLALRTTCSLVDVLTFRNLGFLNTLWLVCTDTSNELRPPRK